MENIKRITARQFADLYAIDRDSATLAMIIRAADPKYSSICNKDAKKVENKAMIPEGYVSDCILDLMDYCNRMIKLDCPEAISRRNNFYHKKKILIKRLMQVLPRSEYKVEKQGDYISVSFMGRMFHQIAMCYPGIEFDSEGVYIPSTKRDIEYDSDELVKFAVSYFYAMSLPDKQFVEYMNRNNSQKIKSDECGLS